MDELQTVLSFTPNLNSEIYGRITRLERIIKPTFLCPSSLTLKLIPGDAVATFINAYRNCELDVVENIWNLAYVSKVEREIKKKKDSAKRTQGLILQRAMQNYINGEVDIHPYTAEEVIAGYKSEVIKDERMRAIRDEVDGNIAIYCWILDQVEEESKKKEYAMLHPTPERVYRAFGWYNF